MRKAAWAIACVLAGGLVALAMYSTIRVVQYRHLPRIVEMTAACHGGAAAAGTAPSSVPAAWCQPYFADVARFNRAVVTETVLCGLIAAFVFLVLRLRVYPLGGGRRAGPTP